MQNYLVIIQKHSASMIFGKGIPQNLTWMLSVYVTVLERIGLHSIIQSTKTIHCSFPGNDPPAGNSAGPRPL